MSSKIYLIDTNAFLFPYKQYYRFHLAPTFWTQLKDKCTSGNIVTLDKVWDEICTTSEEDKKDQIQLWLESEIPHSKEVTNKSNIVGHYGQIIQHLTSSPQYHPNAVKEWADIKIADPWLIAVALEKGYTIVSFENKIPVQPLNPMKRAKIPNVCEDFNVPYCDLFDMMTDLGFSM